MNTDQKGNILIVGVVAGLVLLIGGLVFFQSQKKQDDEMMPKEEKMTDGKNDSMKKEEAMMAKPLAGKNSFYNEFNQSDYEKALAEGKIVYLEFYANWCPICRAQEPDLFDGFNKLPRADVAGFRVNYKDDKTDEDEKALAEKYKIPYQHHKIVLKDGKVVIDSADTWDSADLVTQLSNL